MAALRTSFRKALPLVHGIGPGASDDFDDGEHDVDGHADTGRDQAFFNGGHKSYPPVQFVNWRAGEAWA
jgi:hypothetical protein